MRRIIYPALTGSKKEPQGLERMGIAEHMQ